MLRTPLWLEPQWTSTYKDTDYADDRPSTKDRDQRHLSAPG